MTQSEVREFIFGDKITNHKQETFLKYMYDGYTYPNNATRKPKTQRRIRQEFHSLGLSKDLVKQTVNQLKGIK